MLTGLVLGIMCVLTGYKKNELAEDYKRKVDDKKGVYLHSKKDFQKFSNMVEEAFPKLTPAELRQLIRYTNNRELPTPSKENVELAEKNVTDLQNTRIAHERDLMGQGNLGLTDPNDPNFEFAVQQKIRSYALKMRNICEASVPPIKLEEGSVNDFGFSNYVSRSTTTNNQELAAAIDKQRAILEYLVEQLLNSKIHRLVSVQRENLESKYDQSFSIASGDVFYLDPLVTARVEGAINTYAFRLEFAGHTESLRLFFNRLSKFELPVVVRDVSIERELIDDEEEEEEEEEEMEVVPGDNPFPGSSPFPVPGGVSPGQATPVQKKPAPKPVVDKNVSVFAIVIEFVELADTEIASEEDKGDRKRKGSGKSKDRGQGVKQGGDRRFERGAGRGGS